jgi:hypothetical protein
VELQSERVSGKLGEEVEVVRKKEEEEEEEEEGHVHF